MNFQHFFDMFGTWKSLKMKHNEIKKLEKLEKNLIYGSAQQKNGEETHILIYHFFPLILSFIDGVYVSVVSLRRFLYYSRNVLGLFLMDI